MYLGFARTCILYSSRNTVWQTTTTTALIGHIFGMDYVSFSALCESFGVVKNQPKLVEQFGTNGLSVVLGREEEATVRARGCYVSCRFIVVGVCGLISQ